MDTAQQFVSDAVRVLSLIMDLDQGLKLYHGWRVGLLARKIAKIMELPYPDQLYYAGLLHDIGAVGLNGHVVLHARKGFTDPQARGHSTLGAEILGEFGPLKYCVPFIQNHHEWVDGSGFPQGKSGSQIPIEASILLSADILEVELRDLPADAIQDRAHGVIRRQRERAVPAVVAEGAARVFSDSPGWCRQIFQHDRLSQILDEIHPRIQGLAGYDGEELTSQLLWLFARVLAAKHPSYLPHSTRVAFFSHRIALAMRNETLDPLETLWAGLMHDVGIVGIPTTTLQNGPPLKDVDAQWYRQHPFYTQEVMANIGRFAHLAAGSAAHHEQYDGRGFPKGLRGAEIPLLGRVLAYAERYDQLTGGLPVSESSLSHEEALAVMRQDLGRRLDPQLAYVALNTLADIGQQTLRLPQSLESFRRYFQPELDPSAPEGGSPPSVQRPTGTPQLPLPGYLSSTGQLYRSLLASCEAVAFADEQGVIVDVNPAFERLFGYTRKEMQGYDPGILGFRDSKSAVSEQMRSMLNHHGTWSGEVHDRHKSGRPISILLIVNTIYHDHGDVAGYMAHAVDISDRKEMERNLADMALFAELNPDPVLRINVQGNILMSNGATRNLLHGQIVEGALWQDVCPGFISGEMDAAIQSNGIYQHGVTFGDQEFQFTYQPIPQSDRIQLYGTDITARVRSEATLRKRERQLEAQNVKLENLNRLMGDLMAITSHDLKSPLNGIIGYANLTKELLQELPAESLAKYLDRIVGAAEELVTFINQILSEQMIASGEFSINPSSVRLDSILAQHINGMRHMAERRNVRMGYTVLGHRRPIEVDGARMGQAFTNLLSNALKFAPEGSEISAVYDGRDTYKVRILIADQGPGVPASDHEAVFDRYHQVRQRKSNSQRAFGSGLGLYIIKEIVTRHGGRVWVEDRTEGGCRFIVEIPIPKTADVTGHAEGGG